MIAHSTLLLSNWILSSGDTDRGWIYLPIFCLNSMTKLLNRSFSISMICTGSTDGHASMRITCLGDTWVHAARIERRNKRGAYICDFTIIPLDVWIKYIC